MAGINLKQDSNEFKIRMVQDTGPGRQGRQKDSACTDHFTRYARHEVYVQVLEALNFWMGFHLAEGNSIELDGLGYFTPTLKSRTVTDENGKTKVIAEADTVSFRCATSLKEQVREAGLEQVKKAKTEKLTQEQRLENIMKEVNKNRCINTGTCVQINHYSRFMALNDLKLLIDSNKLVQIGRGKQTMYIRSF